MTASTCRTVCPHMGPANKYVWRSLCNALPDIVYTHQKDEISSSVGANQLLVPIPIRTWGSSLSAAATTTRLVVLCVIPYRDPRCGRYDPRGRGSVARARVPCDGGDAGFRRNLVNARMIRHARDLRCSRSTIQPRSNKRRTHSSYRRTMTRTAKCTLQNYQDLRGAPPGIGFIAPLANNQRLDACPSPIPEQKA